MASYSRYEEKTTRVVFPVPMYQGYAVHAEVLKAIWAARKELDPRDLESVADDAVKVSATDEAILVWYEKKGE